MDHEDIEPRVRVGGPLEDDVLLPPCAMQPLVANAPKAVQRDLRGACWSVEIVALKRLESHCDKMVEDVMYIPFCSKTGWIFTSLGFSALPK
jgi:hypothetical protein